MSANAITDDDPYEIRCNPIVGRCLVATRDLGAGETVFREEAVAVGPLHETRPVCLECLQPVGEPNERPRLISPTPLKLSGPVDSAACAGCSLPLCNKDECSKHRNYHSHRECELLQKASPFIDLLMMDPHPFYQCIMPLRCLLLKETDPDKWAAVKVACIIYDPLIRLSRKTLYIGAKLANDEIINYGNSFVRVLEEALNAADHPHLNFCCQH